MEQDGKSSKAPQPKAPRVVGVSPKAPLPKTPRTPSACREVAEHRMEVQQTIDPVTGEKALRIVVKLEVLTAPDRAPEFAEMLRYDASEIEKHTCSTLEDILGKLRNMKVEEE